MRSLGIVLAYVGGLLGAGDSAAAAYVPAPGDTSGLSVYASASCGLGMSTAWRTRLLGSDVTGPGFLAELGADVAVLLGPRLGAEAGVRVAAGRRVGTYEGEAFRTRSLRVRVPLGLSYALAPEWRIVGAAVLTQGKGFDEGFRFDRPGGLRVEARAELRHSVGRRFGAYVALARALGDRYPGSFVHDPRTRAVGGMRVRVLGSSTPPRP